MTAIEKMLRLMAPWWAIKPETPPIGSVDYIICLTMGATDTCLTKAGYYFADLADWLMTERYNGARILYSAYAWSTVPEMEEDEKKKLFPSGRYVGRVNNAVHEADAFVRALPNHVHPPTLLVVTDEWLSRSMRSAFKSRLRAHRKPARIVFMYV